LEIADALKVVVVCIGDLGAIRFSFGALGATYAGLGEAFLQKYSFTQIGPTLQQAPIPVARQTSLILNSPLRIPV